MDQNRTSIALPSLTLTTYQVKIPLFDVASDDIESYERPWAYQVNVENETIFASHGCESRWDKVNETFFLRSHLPVLQLPEYRHLPQSANVFDQLLNRSIRCLDRHSMRSSGKDSYFATTD